MAASAGPLLVGVVDGKSGTLEPAVAEVDRGTANHRGALPIDYDSDTVGLVDYVGFVGGRIEVHVVREARASTGSDGKAQRQRLIAFGLD